ncbi:MULTISPECIES: haloacid dehalogenase type II [Mycobacteriaceae]|uniref:Haloacid dehalogenase type II n=5 Tax=Mycobacteriaceae TaxID=1762 RepID=A0AAE4VFU5_MYCFO|nr:MULTISPECIES: haloacid dehalogenase type II [Mycobacteriaceae]AGM31635.1 haloacetate dehalogenase [Mycobacteroides abscessus subsp. bolletii 50594]MBV0920266.1 haloacid dehalogenase type II [Mycobacteroides chelonae]MCT7366466.1 haloacid dehalogenase, type II [Mycolicibacterium llatzerense]MCT7372531.1 haloacid dehalogenase, type II [Mycolicibacterium llatzerense]MCV7137727.1 haloacid dehalogenase type II [Mycolicibacterium fortuitum]
MKAPVSRRGLLGLAAAAGLGVSQASFATAAPSPPGPIRAVAFDAFTVFDRRAVDAAAEDVFPGTGTTLIDTWRTRQFEYTWLRTLTGTYTNFWTITQDALEFAVQQSGLQLSPAGREQLMNSWLQLTPWPEAPAALHALKESGLHLAFLSDATTTMLDSWVTNAELEGVFDPHLSTDRVQAFKPDPRAYQMGVDAFGLPRTQIAFSAHGGWDSAGASTFGYRTFWVNRTNAPTERLPTTPEATGPNLTQLAAFIDAQQ